MRTRRRMLAPAAATHTPREGFRTPGDPALRALQPAAGRGWGGALRRELVRQAAAEQGCRAVDGRGQTGGEGGEERLLRGSSREPLLHQRGELRAVGGGEGEGGGRAAEGGQEDVGSGTGRGRVGRPLRRLFGLRDVTPREARPPAVVACGTGEPRSGDPAEFTRGRFQPFPAPPQMLRPLDAVEGGAQGALSVRELLGQRLHRDVGAVGEAVEVRGDGRLAGWEVREIVTGAGELARRGAFSVTRIGHRVRGRLRGEGSRTELGFSHGSSPVDLVGQAPVGVGAPAGAVSVCAR